MRCRPAAVSSWGRRSIVPSGIPRSFEIAYIPELAEDIAVVQQKREAGEEVMGEMQRQEQGEDKTEQGTDKMGQNLNPYETSRTDSVPDFTDAMVMTFQDLPPIVTQQIEHFFTHYKDLEPGKWVKINHWGHVDEAKSLIQAAVKRAAAAKK